MEVVSMEQQRVRVYVPVEGSNVERMVLPGSGIVGTPRDTTPMVLIDYEGNKYGSANLGTWEERLLHARGRHVTKYPTVARAAVPEGELVHVGWYDGEELRVSRQDDVDAWLAKVGEVKPWITRFAETTDDGAFEHVAVVWAPTAEAAGRRSGLVVEAFVEASDDELDEWQSIVEAPLADDELSTLSRLVASELRNLARRRLRDRQSGRWDSTTPTAYDANRTAARRLTTIAAKLSELASQEVN